MDSTLNPAVKRQLLFIGASLGISLVLTYFFGFLVGFALNIAIFLGIIFYIRKKQTQGLRSLGFSDERIGGGYTNSGTGLRYICLSCDAEVSGPRCRRCGSKMKKPVF
jgi:hypothetical protein